MNQFILFSRYKFSAQAFEKKGTTFFLMRFMLIFIFILLLIVIQNCFSQDEEIEKLLEEDAEYYDQSDLLDRLLEFKKNPININMATEQQLSSLPWITPSLAHNIINHRDQCGLFKNLEELVNVPDITPELFSILKNYLTVEIEIAEKVFEVNQRSRVVRKTEDVSNFYLTNKYYNQFKLTLYQKYTAGLLLEKDSGEKNLNDLTLYYFKYQDLSKRNIIILGNYTLEVAQGLAFWSPYGYRKGADTIYPARKRERGLLNYTMVDENASLFGIASQICLKIYQLLIFYSYHRLDASLNSSGNVNSFYTEGYHRTPNELAKKDMLAEKLIGSRLVIYPQEHLKIGAIIYKSVYDKPIQNSDFSKNRYDFRGDNNHLYSIDFDFKYNNLFLFGEITRSKNKGQGILFGTNFYEKPVDIVLLFRNYARDFQSLHGSAFGESGGSPVNEQGFYTGFRSKIFRKTNLMFYYDIFKYPWRTYFESMPIAGTDFLFQIEQKINSNLFLTFRLKNKQKEKSIIANDQFQRSTTIFNNQNNLKLRIQIEYWPISILKLKGRIEKCCYKINHKSKGLLMYQDIKYQPRNDLDIYFRSTFFDTEDYDSRVYQFENDLPYVLTNQMLYGKGSRWYIYVLYKIFSIFKVSFKYAVTNYENVDSITKINKNNSVHTMSLQIESYF